LWFAKNRDVRQVIVVVIDAEAIDCVGMKCVRIGIALRVITVLFLSAGDWKAYRWKCCNFENGDGNRPEMNSVSRSQAGRSNNLSMANS